MNKIDLVDSQQDQDEVLEYVRMNARQLLQVDSDIFPVSSRFAQQAKVEAEETGTAPGGDLWQASRFEALETYILDSLDAGERLRLKLDNPLGVTSRLVDKYNALIADQQDVLKGDFHTLDVIDEQLEAYQVDMRRDFKYQANHVDNVLYEMAERGDRFFDETLRFGRIFDLVNSEKIRAEFERQVVGDTSQQIERHVNDLIDLEYHMRPSYYYFTGSFPTLIEKEGEHGSQRRLDYVFTNKILADHVIRAEIIADEITMKLSDHLPMIVDFEFAR